MTALRRSMGSRLLATALRPSATTLLACRARTYATSDASDAPAVPSSSESTQIREQSAAEGMRHQPDYNVAVDYRTSYATSCIGYRKAS